MVDKKGNRIIVGDWIRMEITNYRAVGRVIDISESDTITVRETSRKISYWYKSTSLLKLSEQESLLYMLEQ